jgi:hypothetical protein
MGEEGCDTAFLPLVLLVLKKMDLKEVFLPSFLLSRILKCFQIEFLTCDFDVVKIISDGPSCHGK